MHKWFRSQKSLKWTALILVAINIFWFVYSLFWWSQVYGSDVVPYRNLAVKPQNLTNLVIAQSLLLGASLVFLVCIALYRYRAKPVQLETGEFYMDTVYRDRFVKNLGGYALISFLGFNFISFVTSLGYKFSNGYTVFAIYGALAMLALGQYFLYGIINYRFAVWRTRRQINREKVHRGIFGNRQEHAKAHNEQEFTGNKSDDSGFGFNDKTWKKNGSTRTSKPYGTEKHHPDDAALWNVINDPNASEGEQMNALRAVKKRGVKRQGKASASASTA